jgi:nuclear pore complex protein Nup210
LPEYNSSNKCSTSARLRSIAPYSGRKETAVYATDVKTGIVIRCKVFIDNISRIQIFHNSIKLDLDGLATLHVRAFDSEGILSVHILGILYVLYIVALKSLYTSLIWLFLLFCCINCAKFYCKYTLFAVFSLEIFT